MDEAFLPFHELLLRLTAIEGEITEPAEGVRLEINHVEIETPIELTIVSTAEGTVELGIAPPLYPLETSFQPAYHQFRFTTEKYPL